MKTAEAIIVAIAVLVLSASSESAPGQEEISGKGSVSLSQRGVTGVSGQRDFSLQFRPADTDEPFTGSVRVTGADGFNGGSLGDADWQLDGSRLTGKIVQRGMTTVTFAGTVGDEETYGTFTTAGGRTGSWTWEGPPPSADAN